nr:unnamed protein product [Spirometra erinaceieuropaei]
MSGEEGSVMDTVELLCAPKKLERDRGEALLNAMTFTDEELKNMVDWILIKAENLPTWEDVFGAVTLSRILLQKVPDDSLGPLRLREEVVERMSEFDTHYEYRVRLAAAELMEVLCAKNGLPMFQNFLPTIKGGIEENLERDPLCTSQEMEASQKELDLATDRNPNLSKSSLTIFHDTAGWRNLETWMKCLEHCITGLGSDLFKDFRDPEILSLIFKAVNHTNRFVRETGYELLSTVILNHGCHGKGVEQDGVEAVPDFVRVAEQLAFGLADNWSRVRMAALKASRTFFEVPPPPGLTYEDIYGILLPAICLNRFYVAEGVRIFCQDTWCHITQGHGREMLTSILPVTLDYYVLQSGVDNHAVREAACAALAEVGLKLDPAGLKPHLPKLLEALFRCFRDDSWPVRDAACLALGNLINVFPGEVRECGYPDLMAEYFLNNLSDSIPSVRQGAATSIAKVLQSSGDPALEKRYLDYIITQLSEVSQQPADSKGSAGQSRGQGASVTVLTGAEARDAKHTDQVMYSCGSLTPKIRSKGGTCCMDDTFKRATEPWERCDGAIRLIGELATLAPKFITDNIIDKMVSAAAISHYPHHPYLLETACRTIGLLCTGLDKAMFKRNLDSLLPVLAWAVSSSMPLAVSAAEDCLTILSQKLGPNVLRSRIANHFEVTTVPRLLEILPPIPY